MMRRHTEWVNLWNANCDSLRPRSKRDLLQELDVWERSQGGHAPNQGAVSNGGSSLMRKDFNGVGWAANHDADFKQLIASARAKQSVPSAPADAMAKDPKGLSEPLEVFPRLSQTPSSEPKSYQQENRYLSDKSSTHCRNQTLWRSSGISQADTDDGSLDSEKEASAAARIHRGGRKPNSKVGGGYTFVSRVWKASRGALQSTVVLGSPSPT